MSGLDVADGLSIGNGQVTLACPLLAQSGHFETEFQCPLLGVKRTQSPTPPLRPSFLLITSRGDRYRSWYPPGSVWKTAKILRVELWSAVVDEFWTSISSSLGVQGSCRSPPTRRQM